MTMCFQWWKKWFITKWLINTWNKCYHHMFCTLISSLLLPLPSYPLLLQQLNYKDTMKSPEGDRCGSTAWPDNTSVLTPVRSDTALTVQCTRIRKDISVQNIWWYHSFYVIITHFVINHSFYFFSTTYEKVILAA